MKTYTLAFELGNIVKGLPLMTIHEARRAQIKAKANGFNVIIFNTRAI